MLQVAPGDRRENIFRLSTERYICFNYVYIAYLIVPREFNECYMYSNARCCSSRPGKSVCYEAFTCLNIKNILRRCELKWWKTTLANMNEPSGEGLSTRARIPRFGLLLRARSSPRSLYPSITYAHNSVIYYISIIYLYLLIIYTYIYWFVNFYLRE